ncbi:MAG: alpha/beta hydrolase [Pseudohongiellaceae bacterium]
MREKEIKIQSADAVLSGTLCTPDTKGQFPAVLMLHGSGPLDRNENMRGQKLNIFNALAHALAEQGIASLRYDKRGCGKSSGVFIKAGHADFVQDAVQCLDTLATLENVSANSLFILGHSEGSIIAPQVSHHRPTVAGLILLCPFIEGLESILIRQAAQLEKEVDSLPGIAGTYYRSLFRIIGKPRATQQRLLRKVRDTDSAVVRAVLSRHPAKWLREMLKLDTDAIFAATRAPMLLVAGEKDLQCNPQDIFRIAEITQGPSESLLVEGMTHLLRIDENPATIMGSARQSGEPLVGVVIDRIAQWTRNTSAAMNQLHTTDAAGARKSDQL